MSAVDEITKALKKAKLPDWVESTHVETMVDHIGDAAVRVIVVVRADRGDIVKDGGALSDLRRKVHLAIDEVGVDLYPYTRFTIAGEAA